LPAILVSSQPFDTALPNVSLKRWSNSKQKYTTLLRARRERPSRGAAEKRDEGAPV